MLSLITAYDPGTLGTVFSVPPTQQAASIRDVPRGGIQFTAKSGWSAPCRIVWASETLLHGLAMDNQPLGEWQIAQVPKAMAINAQFRLVSIDGQSLKSDAGLQRRVSFQPIYVCTCIWPRAPCSFLSVDSL